MKKIIFLFLLIPFLFIQCSTLKIASDVDSGIDFTQFKTYNFLPFNKQSNDILSDKDKAKLREFVGSELEKRGYTKSTGMPDLAVNIFVIINEKTGTSTYNDYYSSGITVDYYSGPWGYNNPGGVSPFTTMHSFDYKEGTLILDIFDVQKKQLAYQGIAKEVLNAKTDWKKIENIITKLFNKFPKEPKQ